MKKRILFIGGTLRGFKLLEMLVNSGEKPIYAYIMKEDKHETAKVSAALRKFCRIHNITSKVCKKINIDEARNILKLRPDVAFVCGWRTIIASALYNKIPLGCMAAHDSLLPKYRGFAPLNWAIINGEEKTGVTLFRISRGVDSGEIFGQKIIKIGPRDTATEVYPRIIDATTELYREFLMALEENKLKLHKQNESGATYTCKRTPADGEINWNRPATKIYNFIRALSPPYPCAWTRYKGKITRIAKASLPRKQLKYAGNIPGRIISILDGGVLILCGAGQIVVNNIVTSQNKHFSADKIFSSITITLGR
ncbi:MAG: methionyl-tRNA formyltransferase [Candidatus Omnitrophota bacterium]|nr:methionyl-tRNA formyltransferase [Candidatus Omnitrophota bacterium]